jgi:hypothetical protein
VDVVPSLRLPFHLWQARTPLRQEVDSGYVLTWVHLTCVMHDSRAAAPLTAPLSFVYEAPPSVLEKPRLFSLPTKSRVGSRGLTATTVASPASHPRAVYPACPYSLEAYRSR